MTTTTPPRMIAAAIGLVALGAAGATLWLRTGAPSPTMPPPAKAAEASSAPIAPLEVTLSADLVTRAGVRTAAARAGSPTPTWHAPGIVEASSYRQVVVTPVAAGRVTMVAAELGQRVTEGQTLVEIYSPELAEAERTYLSARADLDLAGQKRDRLQKLGSIGAVSQQEVDDARAEHARQTNAVESARAKLRQLGLSAPSIAALVSAADIDPVVRVPAPASGQIIKRAVNRGQNVDEKMELVTIADLSVVWVIADVFERDMARVTLGRDARVISAAMPARVWTGRVTYLDPQVSADTRTLKARVEVSNGDGALRPGLLTDVTLSAAAGAATVLIPREAVQQSAGRAIVFTPQAGRPGAYAVREVSIGAVTGNDIEIREGLSAGDEIVTDGAFALKAEWERTGGRLGPPMAPPAAMAMATEPAATPQRVTLDVTAAGFVPETIQVSAGRPIDLVVTRKTDDTCGTEIVIGDGRQRAALPLNTPVTLKLGPLAKGELKITCGMAMLKGAVVAK